MSLNRLRLKKREDRRLRMGHPWIYSNEVDVANTPLSGFQMGEQVLVEAHDKTLLGVAYINPHSLITARLFSEDVNDRLTLAFFKQKLEMAYLLRQRLFDAPYYRLVYSEGDELPGLVIDRFGDNFVMQTNTAGMDSKKEIIAEALYSLFPNTKSILLRNDSQIREHEGLDTYIKPLVGDPPQEIKLAENGAYFYAPLEKGQKTAWFYDHRQNRAQLQHYVKGANVLDVFSYLGGFAIEALLFGASQVDCIESSQLAAQYIKRNAELNNVGDKVNVICEEAFAALKQLLRSNKEYDVIILDPPAFVKKFKDRKEGLIAYLRLNELALKLLKKGGVLISCSCSMHVSSDDLMQILNRAAFNSKSKVQLLEQGHQGPDHPIHIAIPETDYLKALFVRKIR